MIRACVARTIGALLFCTVLAPRPAVADSLQDCKQRVEALETQRANDPDLAIETCTNYVETAQDDQVIEGHFYLAIAYFNKPDYYHAVKELDLVIDKRRVQIAYIYRGLAYVGEMADDPAFADSAISDLTTAANLGPAVGGEKKAQFWPAYLTRATTNLKKGEDEQALSDEDTAIQLNPAQAVAIRAEFAQAYAQRALQRLASGEYDEAASDVQQAIQFNPSGANKLTPYLTEAQSGQPGPYSAIARGNQHAEDQDYEQAVKDYSEAIRANPLAEAYLDRGYAQTELSRFEDARADFAEAISLDQNDWSAYYAQGELYLSLDQFDQAAADFNQASAIIDRVHDWAHDYEKGRIENARKALQFSRIIQDRWGSYLKRIQAANTYPNWSEPPYDLYAGHHSLRTDERPESQQSTGRTGDPRRPNRPILVVVLLGIIVVFALFAALVFSRGS